MRREIAKATLVTVESLEAAIAKVRNDEVDALVADRETCAVAVLRWPDAGLVAVDASFTVEPMGIAVAAGDPRLATLVQTYLDALEERGVLEKSRHFWLEDPTWVKGLR